VASLRYYIDTSAYLAVLFGEQGHESLIPYFQNGFLLSNVLMVVEAQRNIIRFAREGTIGAPEMQRALQRLEEDVERFTFRELTLDLCRNRVMPLVSTPRWLDLVHLRTALWFHAQAPLTKVVSCDESLLAAARELSLPT
jgi:hypothetical protein